MSLAQMKKYKRSSPSIDHLKKIASLTNFFEEIPNIDMETLNSSHKLVPCANPDISYLTAYSFLQMLLCDPISPLFIQSFPFHSKFNQIHPLKYLTLSQILHIIFVILEIYIEELRIELPPELLNICKHSILSHPGSFQPFVKTRHKLFESNISKHIKRLSNDDPEKAKNKEVPKKMDGRARCLAELKKAGRQLKKKMGDVTPEISDPYSKVTECQQLYRKKTAIIFNIEASEQHTYFEDSNFIDGPERLDSILLCLLTNRLYDRCTILPKKFATFEQITSVHTTDLYNLLEDLSKRTLDSEELHLLLEQFDTVYINEKTFDAAMTAAGSCIELVDQVCADNVQNGIALVRPPGHHARKDSFSGYCFFNNVAICAKFALEKFKLKRILIVDWDLYHGHGTQEVFFDSKEVLYFSIHRYENATVWPYLVQSNYDYVGAGEGKGYNFNVPLNEPDISDIDYLLIFEQILLPIAYEYKPELVIVSGGYDAAGELNVTPAGFAQMTYLLQTFAKGKIAVCLEGGYNLNTLGSCVALTLSALLDDPIPAINPVLEPKPSVLESISNCISCHKQYWNCFKNYPRHLGSLQPLPIPPTSDILENRAQSENQLLVRQKRDPLQSRIVSELIKPPPNKLLILYDETMLLHEARDNKAGQLEHPNRIKESFDLLREYGVLDKCLLRNGQAANEELLCKIHMPQYLVKLQDVIDRRDDSFYTSVYTNEKTMIAAKMAAGTGLVGLELVLNGTVQSAIALIRPPGHHAEPSAAGGFCFFNNIALAARQAIDEYGLNRVLIVDFDVHHANGTYEIFKESDQVLLISIHRYGGNFYPKTGSLQEVGIRRGKGFTVNVPWTSGGQGDAEYLSAFLNIVLPISRQFNPQIVLVSAGFDAAVNDPLGNCNVSPEMFGHMTYLLKSLAGGRIILFLEGGYNVHSVKTSVFMCAKALLGDPLVSLSGDLVPNPEVQNIISSVIEIQKKYWSVLRTYKPPLQSLREVPEENNEDAIPLAVQTSEILFKPRNTVSNCPHLERYIKDIPAEGVNVHKVCQICHLTSNNWQCLNCFQVFCQRAHIEEHTSNCGHPLAISFDNLEIWCYACKQWVDNDRLYETKNTYYLAKFNRPLAHK